MGEFCGCGEPSFRSVTVILPSVDEAVPDTLEVYASGDSEEEGENETRPDLA